MLTGNVYLRLIQHLCVLYNPVNLPAEILKETYWLHGGHTAKSSQGIISESPGKTTKRADNYQLQAEIH